METGMRRYILVGAGGFGREVMPIARAQFSREIAAGQADLHFAVEHLTNLHEINGVPIISLEQACGLPGEIHFNVTIADSTARERIADHCLGAGMVPFSIEACSALDLVANEIGPGAVFCPFTTVTANVRIGRFFHANFYSYVAHDCDIGDFVTFAPRVCCNANIRIEDHAYIGTGAMIRPGSKTSPLIIGRGAVIGIGAVVLSSVAEGAMVLGNPAREFPRFT
jgi:sugar O-acyltransferase (sialic acid O-acetyltransferase NeuD family)